MAGKRAELSFLATGFGTDHSGTQEVTDHSCAVAEEVLAWLVARLQKLGLVGTHETAVLDSNVLKLTVFAQPYTLRCEMAEPVEAGVQLLVSKRQALVDRLLGRARFDDDDAFVRVLVEVLDRETALQDVSLRWR